MKLLKQQIQPTSDTCMAACLAMILDEPVKEIIKKYHKKLMYHEIECNDVLDDYGLKYEKCYSLDQLEPKEGVFLLCVPSLNLEAINHQIVMEFTWDDNCFTIYDPNRKKMCKKYYEYGYRKTTMWRKSLKGYCIDLFISKEDLEQWRKIKLKNT